MFGIFSFLLRLQFFHIELGTITSLSIKQILVPFLKQKTINLTYIRHGLDFEAFWAHFTCKNLIKVVKFQNDLWLFLVYNKKCYRFQIVMSSSNCIRYRWMITVVHCVLILIQIDDNCCPLCIKSWYKWMITAAHCVLNLDTGGW